MGTINICGGNYEYDNYYRRSRSKEINGIVACKTFLNKLRFKKANKPINCMVCKKEKSKATRYIGDNYEKVCCDCSSEWVKNSISELERMKQIILKNKSDWELNEKKWRKEMLVGALS